MCLWPKQPQFLFAYFRIFKFIINETEHLGKPLAKNTQEVRHGKSLMKRFVQYCQSRISNILTTLYLLPEALRAMQLPCKQ